MIESRRTRSFLAETAGFVVIEQNRKGMRKLSRDVRGPEEKTCLENNKELPVK